MTNQAVNKNKKIETLSTIAGFMDVDSLQQELAQQRERWLTAYLAKDFSQIEPLLSPDFRYINGKEISNKVQWHELLTTLWQSSYRADNPLLPDRTRYHFFTTTECMVTLYFKNEKTANVMQELWMKQGDTWKFTALSTVNR